MPKKNTLLVFFVTTIMAALIASCGNDDYTPKPRSYFRIALPGKTYHLFDSVLPYCFEIPSYAFIKPSQSKSPEPYWINVEFPAFNGTLHLSYKTFTIDTMLYKYFEDSRSFVNKHISKANDIETMAIANDTSQVYGVLYDISGSGVASTYQFAVTDSTRHFLRGALYFNASPNNDSMQPVIEFIKQDVDKLIHTLKWKNK